VAGDRVVVGYVVRPHGVRGAVLVKPLTDDPVVRFAAGSRCGSDRDDDLTVASVAGHPSGLVVAFTGVDDRDAAESLAGASLTIDASERLPLQPGEFWPDDLIGCVVVDISGELVGTVSGYEFGAAQDRLVVTRHDGVVAEVPFVDDLVPEVDITSRRVVVELPEGMFEA
jgi:16S rRNA processing protein RimM